MVPCMSNILVCRSIWSWNMRRREQYSMFATLAGSKLSLLITDVMSILKINYSSKGDLHRLLTKLLTGSYTLQSNRIKMFKNESNILCLLCSKDKENIVMSSNSWIFVSCGRHFQLVSLSFNISSISWSIGFLTSSNRL
jgi:hypothetical protein